MLSICDSILQTCHLIVTGTLDGNFLLSQLGFDLIDEGANQLIDLILVLTSDKQVKNIVLGWHHVVLLRWIVILFESPLEIVLLFVELLRQFGLEFTDLLAKIAE